MADNVAITAGVGTTIAADDIGGSVLVQRVKTTWGPDGTANDADVATGKPLPVQVRSATGLIPIGEPTDAKSTATDGTSTSGISIWKQISASIQAAAASLAGTLVVASHAVTNAGTFAVQDAQLVAGATAIAKAEDAASANGDVGVPSMYVETAAPTTTSSQNADYEMAKGYLGHQWVAPPPMTKVSANFNRPGDTTAYAANDAVADNTTAGSVTKMQFAAARGAGVIRRVKVRKSDQTVATPTIRVWFFDATFAVGAGDNAAFANPLQDSIGFADVAVTSAGSDDAVGWTSVDIPFAAATLFCVLQTLSVFTPANAETFTVEIHYIPG